MKKFVSLVVPCRNEEKFIGKCLESLLAQDYPKERMEILVVDGDSKDRTREIVKKFQNPNAKFQIRLLDNPKRITPVAANIGIQEAKGEIVTRLDAHATYAIDYLAKCVAALDSFGADVVGGVVRAVPAANTAMAKAIAIVLSHPFGAGGSRFRLGATKPAWVDTVFGGCYKKEVFESVGLYNEKLVRSQDMELSIRLQKAGKKILLVPDAIAYYYPKSTLYEFFKHNVKDGIWAVYPLKFVNMPFRLRHYIPLLFVISLPLSIWLYIPVSFLVAFQIAWQQKDARLLFAAPLAFAARHFGYGVGSIIGIFKLIG